MTTFQMVRPSGWTVHLQRTTAGNRTSCGHRFDVATADVMTRPGDAWINCHRCMRTAEMALARLSGFDTA